jgi:ParB family chromosome partitioning protein
MEKKALGKGLGALLPDSLPSLVPLEHSLPQDIPVDRIVPNRYQPRQSFEPEELAHLAESVKRNGVLQPVLVRRKADGFFELIAGERRYRAAQLAGLKSIPAIVRNSSDEEAMELALIENLQRADLNPLEEARAYHRLVTEFGLTQEALAQRVGKDRSSIANSLRLLNLPSEIKALIESGQLSTGHAKVLLSLSQPELQIKLARRIIERQLSVRQTEQLVATERQAKATRTRRARGPYAELEDQLQRRLGTKVTIHQGRTGGRIEIYFSEPAELDRLADLLMG